MQKTERLWEIDAARGTAVVMMVLSNLALDLAVFARLPLDIASGFWLYFARATAGLFLLLAGLSLTLSFSRTPRAGFGKYLFRGARIFCYGLLITLVTWLLFPQQAIWFGILHLIGLSVVLAYPFLALKRLNLLIGLLVIAAGFYLNALAGDAPWLLWLGLPPAGMASFDYTPLLPWFGIVLIGVFAGSVFYPDGKRRFALSGGSEFFPARFLRLLGRNSLFIYLVHQPLLVGLIVLAVGLA